MCFKHFRKFAIDLDTSHFSELKSFWIVKCRCEKLLHAFIRSEISWTKQFVNRVKRFHSRLCLVFFDSWSNIFSNPLIFALECINNLCISFVSPSAEQNRHRDFSLFINFYVDYAFSFNFHFEPRTTMRNNFHSKHSILARIWRKKHTSRADNLIDNYTLNTRHNKCSHISHHRDTTEIHILFFDFSCYFVEHLKTHFHWCFVVEIFSLTIHYRKFRFFKLKTLVINCQFFSRKIIDWKGFLKCLIKATIEEISITIKLHFNESWKFKNCSVVIEKISTLNTINFPKIFCVLRLSHRNIRFFLFCHEILDVRKIIFPDSHQEIYLSAISTFVRIMTRIRND